MRVVIDTNIIVSAYLGGVLEIIIKAFKGGKFILIVSKTIADEYFRVLERPKFQIERHELYDFMSLLVSKAEFVTPLEEVNAVVSDSSDNKFLEAALAGEADYLVSGDSHLLELKSFRGIPIVTAHEFVERL